VLDAEISDVKSDTKQNTTKKAILGCHDGNCCSALEDASVAKI
jgi:hypothetical protein